MMIAITPLDFYEFTLQQLRFVKFYQSLLHY